MNNYHDPNALPVRDPNSPLGVRVDVVVNNDTTITQVPHGNPQDPNAGTPVNGPARGPSPAPGVNPR